VQRLGAWRRSVSPQAPGARRAWVRISTRSIPEDRTLEAGIRLRWLLKLRWAAAAGQALAVAFASLVFGIALPLAAIATLVGLIVVSNLAAHVALARGRVARDPHVAGLLVLDVVILTGLLALSGGPGNPFSVLYLIHVALAAVMLGAHWPWAIAGLSIAGFGLLFVVDPGPPAGAHGQGGSGYAAHLYGMWTAFTVAAVAIAYFVVRVSLALRQQEAALAEARERAARSQRLAALATLAAGTAHELGSPLATIAVASKELERALARAGASDALREETRLIRSEVDRCRGILEQMSAEAGQSPMEAPARLEAAVLLEAVRRDLPADQHARVEAVDGAHVLHAPARALRRALASLVRNALEASGDAEPVVLRALRQGSQVVFEVEDRGPGLPEAVLDRLGEPFFTTKGPDGHGLGVFLARALAEQLGGSLVYDSRPGRGTVARLALPAAGAAGAGATR